MHTTSEIYKELLASPHKVETRLTIGNASTPDGGYDESMLISVETENRVFSGDMPSVGDCVSGQIHVEMIKPSAEIPRRARMVPYVRLTDGIRSSEWIQKGVYYIDTRTRKDDGTSLEKMVLHGYDDMLKAEQDYPSTRLDWPARDIQVVQEIASFMGVPVDQRTIDLMKHGYSVQYPAEYSCREVLGYIAAMYGGCFIMSDLGALRLVAIWDVSAESRNLITHDGFAITFGGVRIIV